MKFNLLVKLLYYASIIYYLTERLKIIQVAPMLKVLLLPASNVVIEKLIACVLKLTHVLVKKQDVNTLF